MTALVVWWGSAAIRRARASGWSGESRASVALVLALAGSAALAFNYTRDRSGGVAVVFYALASFYAVRAAVERLVSMRSAQLGVATLALLLLSAAWQIRAMATLEYERDRASDHRKEWMVDLYSRRVDFADRPIYVRTLNALVEQGIDPSAATPTPYPRWVIRLIGER
jgi:hypothetical protein